MHFTLSTFLGKNITKLFFLHHIVSYTQSPHSLLFKTAAHSCSVSRSSSGTPDANNLLDDTTIISPSDNPDPLVGANHDHHHASASALNRDLPQRSPSMSSCDSVSSGGSRRNRGKRTVSNLCVPIVINF